MILNNVDFETYFKHYPNNEGYFGKFGGAYVSPELKKAMEEITEAYFALISAIVVLAAPISLFPNGD